MATKSITITVRGGTITAEPNNGNVFDGHPNDKIEWKSNVPFAIGFVDLSGGGLVLSGTAVSPQAFELDLRVPRGTFFKYTVIADNLVLDPYIGVT